MTVAELLDGQPQAAIRNLWEPLCIAALNTPLAVASAQIFLNVLAAAFAREAHDSDTLMPRVDLSSLFPDAAAAYVVDRGGSIRKGTTVTGVAPRGDHVVLRSGYTDESFGDAVIAVGPHQLEPSARRRDRIARGRPRGRVCRAVRLRADCHRVSEIRSSAGSRATDAEARRRRRGNGCSIAGSSKVRTVSPPS